MSQTRYNLGIPTENYKSLQKIAEQEGTTIIEEAEENQETVCVS